MIVIFFVVVANVSFTSADMADSLMYELGADLDGQQQVPANQSDATGMAQMTYDQTIKEFDLELVVNDISADDLVAAHIHQGAPGENGPVIADLGPLSEWVIEEDELTRMITGMPFPLEEESNLLTNQTYINIHTISYPDGEIRGQFDLLTPLPSPSPIATPSPTMAPTPTPEATPTPDQPTTVLGTFMFPGREKSCNLEFRRIHIGFLSVFFPKIICS